MEVWKRYNYLVAAAFDVGFNLIVLLIIIIIFFFFGDLLASHKTIAIMVDNLINHKETRRGTGQGLSRGTHPAHPRGRITSRDRGVPYCCGLFWLEELPYLQTVSFKAPSSLTPRSFNSSTLTSLSTLLISIHNG